MVRKQFPACDIDNQAHNCRHAHWFRYIHIQVVLEDTKEVIRIRIIKKKRQNTGQKKKYKRTNNDLQNTHYKAKDRATRIPLKTEGELGCSCKAHLKYFFIKTGSMYILNRFRISLSDRND